jgi:ribosomal protein L4
MKMHRISLDVTPEQHRQLKTLASFAGLSMREFILSRVFVTAAESVFQPRHDSKTAGEIEKIESIFFDKKKAVILSEEKWARAQSN